MTPPLSPQTRLLIETLFEMGDRPAAAQILIDECGHNLPFCQDKDEIQLERIRFGVLRLSLGKMEELHKAVRLAKTDWRDLLMASRFATDLDAHHEWALQTLNPRDQP